MSKQRTRTEARQRALFAVPGPEAVEAAPIPEDTETPEGRKPTRPRRVRYFAYGSNVDQDQMRARCPSARLLGTAVLPDHGLVFAGHSAFRAGAVATVFACPGLDVPGALFTISRADRRALDACEGVPWLYRRARARVVRPDGRAALAAVYALRDEHFILGAPARAYLGQIVAAYRRLGLPMSALTIAVALAARANPALVRTAVDFDAPGPNVRLRPERATDQEDECE